MSTKYSNEKEYFEKNQTKSEDSSVPKKELDESIDSGYPKSFEVNKGIDYSKYSKNIAHSKVIGRIVEQNKE